MKQRVTEFSAGLPQPAFYVVEPLWNESNGGLNQESRVEGRFTQQLNA